eukprot:GILJ01002128.1.p1 GENE.GILJ01002128.1~~GILJ01002128.1.p1  ORF type:complete len:439 (-),score=42.49 GILJ01002128.1:352-1668(-)
MLRLSVLCVLLCLLVLQVLGGGVGKKIAKAQTVCSAIPKARLFGTTVDVSYSVRVRAREELVWARGCPLHLPKTMAAENPITITVGLRALLEIQDWVCGILLAANELGVKTHIDSNFYEDLVDSMFVAYGMLKALSKVGDMHNVDALHLVDAVVAAKDVMSSLAEVLSRLPCFCQLIELMAIPRMKDHMSMCTALLATTDKPSPHPKHTNVHKAATVEFWAPVELFAVGLPVVERVKDSTCGLDSLTGAWAATAGGSWFACTAVYRVDGYEVFVVPAGLLVYHGSRTLAAMTVPDGMLWLGEHSTGSRYVNTAWKTKRKAAETPALHSFVTKKNIFVVHLMDYENNRRMQESLPNHLYLTHVTGYPVEPLRRSSDLSQDKAVFRNLCGKWPQGVYGYADNYPLPSTLHPEMMLCDARGLIQPLGPVTPAKTDIVVEPL